MKLRKPQFSLHKWLLSVIPDTNTHKKKINLLFQFLLSDTGQHSVQTSYSEKFI